jgi:hypothetical protein
MNHPTMLRIPDAPMTIRKGFPLKNILGRNAVDCLADNLAFGYPGFSGRLFRERAMKSLEPLSLMERVLHLAKTLRVFLPEKFEKAVEVLLASLTPPNTDTDGLGLAVLFYLPHGCFIAEYGLDKKYNGGEDPFEISWKAQYELTKRNTVEYIGTAHLVDTFILPQ